MPKINQKKCLRLRKRLKTYKIWPLVAALRRRTRRKTTSRQHQAKMTSPTLRSGRREKVAVEDNFTTAMQEAILQSDLDFEQKKEVEAAWQQLLNTGQGSQVVMDSLDKEDRKKVVKLKKKLNTMTLDQFNSASEQEDSPNTNGEKVKEYIL